MPPLPMRVEKHGNYDPPTLYLFASALVKQSASRAKFLLLITDFITAWYVSSIH